MLQDRSRRQRLFALLMLLSLLLQVQTVLACQMLGIEVAIDIAERRCCCEPADTGVAGHETDHHSQIDHQSQADHHSQSIHDLPSDHRAGLDDHAQSDHHPDSDCCEISTDLTLKQPDAETDLPALVQSQSSCELAELVPVLLAALWPELVSQAPTLASWRYPPPSGPTDTKIYLATQRLRI